MWEAQDSRNASDLVKGQLVSQMAFDEPERHLGRIHGPWPPFEARAL
jgi:hypothetical protein